MRDDDGRIVRGADCLKNVNGHRGQSDILLVFPQIFVHVTANAKFFEQASFEFVNRSLVRVPDIDKDHFG